MEIDDLLKIETPNEQQYSELNNELNPVLDPSNDLQIMKSNYFIRNKPPKLYYTKRRKENFYQSTQSIKKGI